jgi:HlyD family secretion protein
MKKLIPILLLAGAAAAAYYFLRPKGDDPSRIRLSGNLEITELNLAFKTSGRIVALPVREGDTVRKGQLLARMESESLAMQKQREEAGVAAARSGVEQLRIDIDRQRDVLDREAAMRRAEIAQAEAQLKELEAGSRTQEIAQAEAAVDDARAQLAQARADWERAQTLFKNEDISRVQHDQAQTRLRSATAAVQATEQRLSLVKTGPRVETIELARAQVARARAALQLTEANRKEIARKQQELTLREAEVDRARAQVGVIDVQINDAELRAPTDGVVLSRPADLGEVMAPGVTALTLGDVEHPWMRGYITETQLGRVKLGQKVRLKTDSFPGKEYEGRISFISSEAEFTPKQIQTPEERVKLVYRIKVDVPNPARELKNNMPVDAEIVLP